MESSHTPTLVIKLLTRCLSNEHNFSWKEWKSKTQRETVMEIKTKATFFLANILLALRQEWTAVLNQTTWDVIPCSIEERLDISIVKTHTHIHTYKKKWRWKEERQREWKRGISKNKEALARTKRGEDSSQWNCETIRYRFCHGCVTLTVSCSPLCLSHVGWLLMEPSYPSWTSVMKFYWSYWIWWRDLCLSLSSSLSQL